MMPVSLIRVCFVVNFQYIYEGGGRVAMPSMRASTHQGRRLRVRELCVWEELQLGLGAE